MGTQKTFNSYVWTWKSEHVTLRFALETLSDFFLNDHGSPTLSCKNFHHWKCTSATRIRTNSNICVYICVYISGTERACHDSDSLIVCCQSGPRETRCTSWWLFFLSQSVTASVSISSSFEKCLSIITVTFRMSSTAKIISDSLASSPPSDITYCFGLRLCCIQVVRNSRLQHRF